MITLDQATALYSRYHQARIRREETDRTPEQLARSLADWSEEAIRPRVAIFLQEIDQRIYSRLAEKNNGLWPAYWTLFQAHTGIKIPKTQKGITQVLIEYCGQTAYQDYLAAKETHRQKEQETFRQCQKRSALQNAKGWAERIRIAGESLNGAEWVEHQLATGWQIENISTNRIPKYRFTHSNGRTLKAGKGWSPLLTYGRLLQEQKEGQASERAGEGTPEPTPIIKDAAREKLEKLAKGTADFTWLKTHGFIGGIQAKTVASLLRESEEAEYFADKMTELAERIRTMPQTYGQSDNPDPICHIRYFAGGSAAWHITEKDKGSPTDAKDGIPPQSQAFGHADLFGDGGEIGYISIAEILSVNGELDFHFKPTPLSKIQGRHDTEPTQPTPPEPSNVIPFEPKPAHPAGEPKQSQPTSPFANSSAAAAFLMAL